MLKFAVLLIYLGIELKRKSKIKTLIEWKLKNLKIQGL